ncbi:MAG: transcriptional activator RfaH [Lysobacterales bacterium]
MVRSHREHGRHALLNWFAVLTKPRAEGEAALRLAQQGFDCLYARTRRSVRAASGMLVRTESLFPRYVFLRSDPDLQSLAPVRSTRGVAGLVRFGGVPAVVPDLVIEQIRARMDPEDGFVRLQAPVLTPGSPVRIHEGPFSGLDAIFEQYLGSERVRLLLVLLGSERGIVLPRAAIGSRI